MDSLQLTREVVEALDAKHAQDIIVLDLHGLTVIADYFVIATGTSRPNLRALMDAVLDTARTTGVKGVRPEGSEDSSWILLDLGDIIVHLFDAEHREFYQLERLWADAPRVSLDIDPA